MIEDILIHILSTASTGCVLRLFLILFLSIVHDLPQSTNLEGGIIGPYKFTAFLGLERNIWISKEGINCNPKSLILFILSYDFNKNWTAVNSSIFSWKVLEHRHLYFHVSVEQWPCKGSQIESKNNNFLGISRTLPRYSCLKATSYLFWKVNSTDELP